MKLVTAAFAAVFACALPAVVWAQNADPFIVAINHEPDTLDPTKSINNVLSRPVLENIVEPVIGLAENGDLVPGATSFEYQDEGRTLILRIRDGLTFHSGDPATADDIIFSHERFAAHSTTYQARLANFDSIEKIDDMSVAIRFTQPDVTYLVPRSLSLVSKAYFDRVGEEAFAAHPVGTGPYKFVSYAPAQSFVMTANDGYWGGAPEIRDVEFAFVREDSTRVAMLRAGEADMILNVPFMDVSALEAEGFVTSKVAVTPSTSLQFTLNNPDVPWHDVRVRRAIAHAVDAESIVSGLFDGVPERYARFAPDEVGYDPDLQHYEYNPDLAKELLAEAGYPNGFTMPLVWWHGENYGIRETAEAVALYLGQVGITAEVSSWDVPEFLGHFRAARENPTTENWVGITPTPLANYYDPVTALAFTFLSSAPMSQYSNPEFDALVRQAMATVDTEERAPLVIQATRILHDDIPQATLWNNVAVYAMREGVSYTPVPRHLIRAFMFDVDLVE